jgi:ribulose kinase
MQKVKHLMMRRFRSPIADPKAKGIICGLTLDASEKQLALQYLATLQGIAYGTRHIVEHCNAHGHKVRIRGPQFFHSVF